MHSADSCPEGAGASEPGPASFEVNLGPGRRRGGPGGHPGGAAFLALRSPRSRLGRQCFAAPRVAGGEAFPGPFLGDCLADAETVPASACEVRSLKPQRSAGLPLAGADRHRASRVRSPGARVTG